MLQVFMEIVVVKFVEDLVQHLFQIDLNNKN